MHTVPAMHVKKSLSVGGGQLHKVIMHRSAISLCQSTATSVIVKCSRSRILTHASSATANVHTFTSTYRVDATHNTTARM